MTKEDTTEEQKVRSALRKQYLENISDLNGEPCTLTHYEKQSLKAVFCSMNSETSDILVTDLVTPIATYESAIIRASDIVSIKFDKLYK